MTEGQNQAQSAAQGDQEHMRQEQERMRQEQARKQQDNKPLSTEDMAHTPQKDNSAAMGPATRITPPGPEPVRAPTAGTAAARPSPLLGQNEIQTLRTRWTDIQAGFVDEPRQSVQLADTLVAELMQNLAQSFAAEKNKLEGQWERGQEVSTEDLRVALQHYRSFFDRLLSF